MNKEELKKAVKSIYVALDELSRKEAAIYKKLGEIEAQIRKLPNEEGE